MAPRITTPTTPMAAIPITVPMEAFKPRQGRRAIGSKTAAVRGRGGPDMNIDLLGHRAGGRRGTMKGHSAYIYMCLIK